MVSKMQRIKYNGFLLDSICFGFGREDDLLRNEKIFRSFMNFKLNLFIIQTIINIRVLLF